MADFENFDALHERIKKVNSSLKELQKTHNGLIASEGLHAEAKKAKKRVLELENESDKLKSEILEKKNEISGLYSDIDDFESMVLIETLNLDEEVALTAFRGALYKCRNSQAGYSDLINAIENI